MVLRYRHVLAILVAVLTVVAVAVVALPRPAEAHGAMMKPGSRTYLCWRDGLTPQGNIVPSNAACAAAVGQSGTTPLYNWFGVLRSDGAGRTRGFIPDGQLCSGGNPGYAGYDLNRDDWPVTHLTSGADFNWWYSNWAAHPGTFSLYVTKDTWSPTRMLTWDDFEATPFLQVTNPPQQGSVGTADGHYYWSGALPAGKSGRHIVYSVWSRSDSQETFYNCSDVVFDGGAGEVTGIGGGTPPTPQPTPPASSGCSAMFSVASSWPNGFQGNVMVHAGASALDGWTVRWTFPGSQAVSQLWNGTVTQTGSLVSVGHAGWNAKVPAGGSTTFGFVGTGTAPPALDNLSCTSP